LLIALQLQFAPQSGSAELRMRLDQKPQTCFNSSLLRVGAAAPHSSAHQPVVNFNISPHEWRKLPMCKTTTN
jgi:hypothetical protein